jgi:general secretion pathway protein E
MEAEKRLPYAFAKRHGAVITAVRDDAVEVMHRPALSAEALLELRRFAARPLHLTEVTPEVFDGLLQSSYEVGAGGAQAAVEAFDEELDLARVAEELGEPEDLLESQDDAPIIRLINALLTEAVKVNASDIHIEPFENRLVVRIRVDGVQREVHPPNRVLAPQIV